MMTRGWPSKTVIKCQKFCLILALINFNQSWDQKRKNVDFPYSTFFIGWNGKKNLRACPFTAKEHTVLDPSRSMYNVVSARGRSRYPQVFLIKIHVADLPLLPLFFTHVLSSWHSSDLCEWSLWSRNFWWICPKLTHLKILCRHLNLYVSLLRVQYR